MHDLIETRMADEIARDRQRPTGVTVSASRQRHTSTAKPVTQTLSSTNKKRFSLRWTWYHTAFMSSFHCRKYLFLIQFSMQGLHTVVWWVYTVLYVWTTQCCMTGLHSVVCVDYTVLYDGFTQCCMCGLHSLYDRTTQFVWQDYTVCMTGLHSVVWWVYTVFVCVDYTVCMTGLHSLYDRTTQCCMTGLHSVVWQDYNMLYDRTTRCCNTVLYGMWALCSVVWQDYTVFVFSVGFQDDYGSSCCLSVHLSYIK